MYKKINQSLKGVMAAMLLVTLFATACNNEVETTETTTDTTVTTAPATDTTMHDTMHMDTTGVKKPIVTPN